MSRAALASGLLALPCNVALGALACAGLTCLARRSRRRWVLWRDAALGLTRLLPACAALGAAGLALAGGWPAAAPAWVVLLTATPATAGCAILLHAARLERRGRLGRARRAAWLGGAAAAAGSVLFFAAAWLTLLFQLELRRMLLSRSTGGTLAFALGLLAIGLGAFVAMVAGLARKSRPGAVVAAVLYGSGLLAVLGAMGVAERGP